MRSARKRHDARDNPCCVYLSHRGCVAARGSTTIVFSTIVRAALLRALRARSLRAVRSRSGMSHRPPPPPPHDVSMDPLPASANGIELAMLPQHGRLHVCLRGPFHLPHRRRNLRGRHLGRCVVGYLRRRRLRMHGARRRAARAVVCRGHLCEVVVQGAEQRCLHVRLECTGRGTHKRRFVEGEAWWKHEPTKQVAMVGVYRVKWCRGGCRHFADLHLLYGLLQQAPLKKFPSKWAYGGQTSWRASLEELGFKGHILLIGSGMPFDTAGVAQPDRFLPATSCSSLALLFLLLRWGH